jgi:DNA repair photolyase
MLKDAVQIRIGDKDWASFEPCVSLVKAVDKGRNHTGGSTFHFILPVSSCRGFAPDLAAHTRRNSGLFRPSKRVRCGPAYCYARPFHEYLGFSSGLDFESKIMVKEKAPALLRQELSSPKWRPAPIGMSGVTDCYQPIERRLKLTRQCLAVLAEFRNPVSIITKNALVTRDLDLLRELAAYRAVHVNLSITTLDADLARKLEPRAASPKGRLAAMETLAKAGVPVGVLVAPAIPAINDHEIPSVLAAAKAAGASWAYTEVLRLPLTVAPIFQEWLEWNFPERKEKVLGRIRAIRGGKLNDPRFGSRMRGEGIFADQISQMFHVACRKLGLPEEGPELSAAAFRRPQGAQLGLGLAFGTGSARKRSER